MNCCNFYQSNNNKLAMSDGYCKTPEGGCAVIPRSAILFSSEYVCRKCGTSINHFVMYDNGHDPYVVLENIYFNYDSILSRLSEYYSVRKFRGKVAIVKIKEPKRSRICFDNLICIEEDDMDKLDCNIVISD